MLKINLPKDEKKIQKHQIKVNGGEGKSLETRGKAKSIGPTKETVEI